MHHWHILTSFGPRFYRGGAAPCTFTEAIPAYGHAMAVLDVDPRGENLRWKPLPELCDEVLIKKLERDDKFWTDFVRKSQIAAGTPELVPENLDVIQSLCMNGSWDSDHWNYLRMQLGPGAVEDAINKLHESGDLNKPPSISAVVPTHDDHCIDLSCKGSYLLLSFIGPLRSDALGSGRRASPLSPRL